MDANYYYLNQLSIYEFLSYFLPGFIAVELSRLLLHYSSYPLSLGIAFSDTEKTLLVLAAALFAGLVLHRCTFWLLAANYKWYASSIMPSMATVVASSKDIQHLLPHLNEYCSQLANTPFFIDEHTTAPYFFDYAYYFLESNDKIASAKGFQSMYFFCRNIFTLSIIVVPVLLLVMASVYFSSGVYNLAWLLIVALLLLVLFTARYSAVFFRIKMVERVFWNFHLLKSAPLKK